MVVRIRLARFGRLRSPTYNIVVTQARSARGSKPMEVLGTYDPVPRVPLSSNLAPNSSRTSSTSTQQGPGQEVGGGVVQKKQKDIKLDLSRTKYWLGVGAQPSEPVERLLALIGLVERRPGKGRGVVSR